MNKRGFITGSVITILVVGYFLAQSQYIRYNLNNLSNNKVRVQNEYDVTSTIALSSHLLLNKLSNMEDISLEYIREDYGNELLVSSSEFFTGELNNVCLEVVNILTSNEDVGSLTLKMDIEENKELLELNTKDELQFLINDVDANIDPVYFLLEITTQYSNVKARLRISDILVEQIIISDSRYSGTILCGYNVDNAKVEVVNISY